MSNFVLRSYISGVQQYLNDAGHVKYASEQNAEIDNASLAAGLEAKVPALLKTAGAPNSRFNNEAIAGNSMPDTINASIAVGISKLAQVTDPKAKAAIIEKVALEVASNEKVAEVLIVAGQGEGSPTATDSKEPGMDEQFKTQVDNDSERTSPRTSPGTQADEGKGQLGVEEAHGNTATSSAPTKPAQDNATEVDTDAERHSPVTPAGQQSDAEKGQIGTQETREKISQVLSNLNL